MREWLTIAVVGLALSAGQALTAAEEESLSFYDPYNFVPPKGGEFSSISERRSKRQAVLSPSSTPAPASTEGKTTRKPVERINIDPKWFNNADNWLTNGETDDTVDKLWKRPENETYDKEDDTTDHQYYTMQVISADEEKTKQYWVDVDELLEKPGVVGNRSHPLLKNSYRRAVGAKLSFNFPFYGHKMNNLTIATGGFCYIGDQTHSWLAATQYIAPLMANFDTQLEGSNILYADDGERFVVEWRKVQLRMQKQFGDFTFQVVLHKNGTMHFVYKDVPVDPMDISDAHHPCKLGISDAYLFHHSTVGSINTMSKRVIYEYHRIEVNATKVRNNTVVILQALPTCMSLTTCAECSNATLGKFVCSWCHAKRANGGPFCTDQAGLHRRRQQFIEGNCKDQRKTIYCPTNEAENENEVEDDASASPSPADDSATPTVVPLDTQKKGASASLPSPSSSGGVGSPALFFLMSLVLVAVGWLAYAYYNPQTASGQLLIRYRPSRWHVPSSHVRYSASVHM
ncbi:hypothetical protein PENTCL1PPCAC_12207 [Pristionchus entomophagus]|uniref:Plexin domain-containing protein 2 n=1 Tax=Pristionchus entomophagus TaxID=358040 RepID=A0AAV5T6E7_9BILA|nr:hypothetical protein PENTCL1PPCAC_12207 [Pristionchus entomophagus]